MADVKSDIEIARAATKKPILEIGAKLGIPPEHLLPYGHDKAKISAEFISQQKGRQDGRLILVTDNPNSAANGMDMSGAIVDPNNGVAMLTIGSQTFTFPLCPVPPPPQTIPPPSVPPRGMPPGDCDPSCPPPNPPWCDSPSGFPSGRPTQPAPQDGPCCSSCAVGLPCESGCDNHDHSH
jgi:hypothetical protein